MKSLDKYLIPTRQEMDQSGMFCSELNYSS